MRRFAPPPGFFLTLAVPFALLTAGCSDVDPTAVDADLSESAAALVETELRADRGTIDDRWAAISQTEVPGFAGYWYDQATQEIVVAATEIESEGAAREWAGRSPAASDFPGAPVRFELVSYDFMQLRTWKAAAHELVEPDVVYIDADEVQNRLVLGVTPGAVASQVRARTRELGIPNEGLVLVTRSPFKLDHGGATGESVPSAGGSTLKHTVRPTMGGLQVKAQSRNPCTLGFNAVLVGGSEDELYLSSASHCSTSGYDPDTGYWQQDSVGPRVGLESHDIEPHTGFVTFDFEIYDCTSQPCRFSDVSLVAYDDSIDAGDVALGRIAETDEASITITGHRDVTQKRHLSTLFTGLNLRMVGQRSGRQSGEITDTCITAVFIGVHFRSQFEGDYDRGPGDSGAPIIVLRPNGSVALIGTHVGLYQQGSIFSTLAGIEEDLAVTLDVCVPTGCIATPPSLEVGEIEGDTTVLEFSNCVYTVDVSQGFPPYSYQWFLDEEPIEDGDEAELELDNVGENSFLLEVRVDDAWSHTEWEELVVNVSPHYSDCGLDR